MTTLAARGDVATIPEDVAQARASLARMKSWIDAAETAEEIGAATDALREAREWMRIKKVSTDLRTEAARIEAIALRRLGQMGCPTRLPSGYKAAALGFAQLSDDEFARLLKRGAELTNPVTIWGIIRNELAAEHRRKVGYNFAQGIDRAGPYAGAPKFVDSRDVATAVRTLLASAAEQGDRFTVAELTDTLVNWVSENADVDPDVGSVTPFIDDPDFRQGMAEVVRHALRSETATADPRMPAFVTYYDGNEGWVRIPWDSATIHDLEAMAQHRRHQARDAAAAAEKYEDLAVELRALSNSNGHEERLTALVSMLAREVIATRDAA